jgi:hypothetical protein
VRVSRCASNLKCNHEDHEEREDQYSFGVTLKRILFVVFVIFVVAFPWV